MSRLPALRDSDVLGSLAASYAVMGEIGRGGMGTVVLAKHRTTGYRVAIKIAATDRLDAELLDRFSREARLMARFRHPNIVQLYGIHEIRKDTIAIVMEYVRGKSLAELLSAGKRLPFDRCRQILLDLGRALAHAHANGVVHRDVKPHNVIIEESSGKAMLFDFGIAKGYADDESVTAAGGTVGTPAYMSPEQIDGRTVDHRSDIYGLGILGWELITGERPWDGVPLYKLLHKQKHEALPALTSIRPDTPNELLLAIEGALVKAPASRWSSVDEMMEQLESDQPTRAMLEVRRRVQAARQEGPKVVSVEAATVPLPRASTPSSDDRTQTLRFPRQVAGTPAGRSQQASASHQEQPGDVHRTPVESATQSAPPAWRARMRTVAIFGAGLAAGLAIMLASSRLMRRDGTATERPNRARPAATDSAPAMAPATASRPARETPLPVSAASPSRPFAWPEAVSVAAAAEPASTPRDPQFEVPPPTRFPAPSSGPTVAAARDLDRRAAALGMADRARKSLFSGQPDRARVLADSAIGLDARNGSAYLVRARALIEKKLVREAWTDIELGARSGAQWEALALTVTLKVRQGGRTEGVEALRRELREALIPRRPLENERAVALAIALVQVGDVNAALTLLELAQAPNADLLRLLEDPLLAPIRTHERFLGVKARAAAASGYSTP